MAAAKKHPPKRSMMQSVAKSAGNDVSGFWMAVLAAISGGLYTWVQAKGTEHGFIFWVAHQEGSLLPGHFGPDAYGIAAAIIPPLLLVLKNYSPKLFALAKRLLPKSLGGGK